MLMTYLPALRCWHHALVVTLTGVLASTAQSEPLQLQNEALRQHQYHQSELQQLQREQRQRQLKRGAFTNPTSRSQPPIVSDMRCWMVTEIRVSGATLIDRATLNSRIQPLVVPCMDISQINSLLTSITSLYVEKGYIASRPYLPSAPLDGQPLNVFIEEGYLESIELADQSLPVSLAGAFPGMLGKSLNLRDLEQGLDQLNRLRSVDLTADIAPGNQPGASRVVLRSRGAGQPRVSIGLGLDNLGSASTGRDRNLLSLSLDNPLALNDLLSVSSSDTLNQGDRYSRSASLYYAMPYGYWTFSLFASRAEYRAPFKLSMLTLQSTGMTDQFSLRGERVLWRDQSHQLSASLQLAHKKVDSELAKERLEIQSPKLTVAEAGLNLFWLDRAVWNLDFNYLQGLRWLGADDDSERPFADLPMAQFHTYRAGLSQWRNGQFIGQTWQWQSQFNLQYSPDPLPAIEQLLATDDSAVRGYRVSSISGASGVIWRNTLRLPLPPQRSLSITPRLGLDHGWVKADQGAPALRLSGASVGLSLGIRSLQFDLDYQRSLNAPKGYDQETGTWLLRAGLQI